MARPDTALMSAVSYFGPQSDYVNDIIPSAIQHKLCFGFMLACAMLAGFTQWFSPIECTKPDHNSVDISMTNQYCYTHSLFVVNAPPSREQIFPSSANQDGDDKGKHVHIRYYQWVTLCLLVQAACFQIPHLIWQSIEGGRVHRLLKQLRSKEMLASEARDPDIRQIAAIFADRSARDNKMYLYGFVFCQILYFANAILQIGLTQGFLLNRFIQLVPQWLAGKPSLEQLFPKLVNCTLRLVGPSNDPQAYNVLCLLGMNGVHEMVYLLMWFVLLVALITSLLQVGYLVSWRVPMPAIYDTLKDGNVHRGEWLALKFIETSLGNRLLYREFENALTQART